MDNPWLGLRTYTEYDTEKFRGRNNDILQLKNIIENNIVSVCYSDSGIGKSSLINAGICPLLKEEQILPIKINITSDYINKNLSIDEAIIDKIRDYMNNHKDNDGEVSFIISNILENDKTLSKLGENNEIQKSLCWYLRTNRFYAVYNGRKIKIKPLIIFDQFEELFYNAKSLSYIEDFFIRIRGLVKDIPTDEVLSIFEEYKKKDNKLPELPNENRFKALFSIRREYLADLDYWTSQKLSIPAFQTSRYRLMPLSKEQAKDVICCPTSNVLVEIADDIIKAMDPNEEQIPSIILSVICHELFKKSMTKRISSEDILIKDILQKVYEELTKETWQENHKKKYDLNDGMIGNRILTEKKISFIEGLLVDENSHRKPINVIDLQLSDLQIQYLKDSMLLKSSSEGGKVELVHDKIAEIIHEKNIHHRNIITNNKLRIEKENVLLCSGRSLMTNCEYICDDEDDIDVIDEVIDTFTKSNQVTIDNEHTSLKSFLHDSNSLENDICISFTDRSINKETNGYISRAIDGIAYISVRYTPIIIKRDNEEKSELKIVNIQFFDEKNEKPFKHRYGYYGIKLDYDVNGNEILRTYVDEKGEPVINYHHYARIKREYNENNLPVRTLYLDEKGNAIKHKDGNYGFKSAYNIDGQEIIRTFIDEKGTITRLKNGIFAQRYEYEKTNNQNIVFFLNLDEYYNPTCDIQGYEGAIQEYDNGICVSYAYCDANKKLIEGIDGWSKSTYAYNTHNQVSIVRYYDSNGILANHKQGYYGLLLDYDKTRRPVIITYIDQYGNPVNAISGYSQLKIVYDASGRIICSYFNDKNNLPCLVDGVHKKTFQYDNINGKISCMTSWDYNDKEVNENNNIFRAKHSYDENWNKVKEEYYSTDNKDVPYTIEYIKTEKEYIIEKRKDFAGEISEFEIKYNYANQIIYERDLTEDHFYHHLIIEYDRDGYRFKEFYMDANDNPCMSDIGSFGREIIYDNQHNELGEASIDELGQRIRCKNGYCVHIKTSSERSFWDTDGVTPLCCDEGYHKYTYGQYSNDGVIRKYVNAEGELCKGPEGFAVDKIYQEGNISTRIFIDENGEICNAGWGIQKSLSLENGNKRVEYYDKSGTPIDYDGYHRKEVDRNPKLHLADIIVYYKDVNGNPADGENPLDDNASRGSVFWIRNNAIMWAKNTRGETICNTNKELFRFWLFRICVAIAYLFYPFYRLWEYVRDKYNSCYAKPKNKVYKPVILIQEVFPEVEDRYSKGQKTIPLCYSLGIREGDIVLSYGNWNYDPNKDWDKQACSFETIFNESQNSVKRIVVARKRIQPEDDCKIIVFWAPANNIGCKITDNFEAYDENEINDILNDYKKYKEQKIQFENNVNKTIMDGLFNTYSTNPFQKLLMHKRSSLFFLAQLNIDEANKHILEAINCLSNNNIKDDILICETYRAASLILAKQNEIEKSLEFAHKALNVLRAQNNTYPSLYNNILLIITYLYMVNNDFEKAKEFLKYYDAISDETQEELTLFMKDYILLNFKKL